MWACAGMGGKKSAEISSVCVWSQGLSGVGGRVREGKEPPCTGKLGQLLGRVRTEGNPCRSFQEQGFQCHWCLGFPGQCQWSPQHAPPRSAAHTSTGHSTSAWGPNHLGPPRYLDFTSILGLARGGLEPKENPGPAQEEAVALERELATETPVPSQMQQPPLGTSPCSWPVAFLLATVKGSWSPNSPRRHLALVIISSLQMEACPA